MADIADLAQQVIEQTLHDALVRSRSDKPLRIGKRECMECGATIPVARRRAVPNTCHCVACASRHEILNARESPLTTDDSYVEDCFDNSELLTLELPETQ